MVVVEEVEQPLEGGIVQLKSVAAAIREAFSEKIAAANIAAATAAHDAVADAAAAA